MDNVSGKNAVALEVYASLLEAAESCLAAAYPAVHIHYADIKLEETSNAFKIQRVNLKFAVHANFLRSLLSCFYQLSVKTLHTEAAEITLLSARLLGLCLLAVTKREMLNNIFQSSLA